MTASEIRFKVTVAADDKTITFEDTTDYTALLGNTYISGLLKIVDPLGNTVYENTGYSTDTYSQPDIIMAGGLQERVTKAMNLDTSSEIIVGDYMIYYKISNVSDSTTITADVESTANSLIIKSVSPADAAVLVELGWIEIISGSTNVGYWQIESSNFDGTDLTINLNTTAIVEQATSSVLFYDSVLVDYATSKGFQYCYKPNDIVIDYTIDCAGSTLISSDNTVYGATINGESFTADSFNRVHSVEAPVGSGFGAIADSADKQRIFSNIWTKIWQTAISTDVSFNVQDWDTSVWYIVTDTLKGSDKATVTCSSCSCDLRQCIINLYQEWVSALSTNRILADRLGVDVLKVTSLYTQYLQAERCGEDVAAFCNQISQILNSSDCSCSVDTDDASTLVVATKDVIVGSQIYVESGIPNDTLGNDRDMYINDTTYDLYNKEDGSWTLKGNIKGEQGEQGVNATPTNFFTHQVSFEPGEIGIAYLIIPIHCTLDSVTAYVSKRIGGIHGRVSLSIGELQIASLIAVASSTYGTAIANTSLNTEFNIGDSLKIETTGGDSQGRVQLVIKYTKL